MRSESGSVQPRFGRGANQQYRGSQRPQQSQFRPSSSSQGSHVSRGASSSSAPGQSSASRGGFTQHTQGRAFAINTAIPQPSTSQAPETAVVRGTFLLFNSFAKVLFDSGASHSFIALSFVRALELETEELDSPLFVETPLGSKSSLNRIC